MQNKTRVLDRCLHTHEGYGCEEVIPGGFVSLMDLYENNYMRFKKLAMDLEGVETEAISHVDGCLSLHLRIVERSRYTTTVFMTYFFDDDEEIVAEPELKLRIYHDAALIEVLAGHLHHGRQRINHLPATALNLKWRLNRFLYKWLGYCLHVGHEIKPVEVVVK